MTTPVAVLQVPMPSRTVRLRLKLEAANRYGSVKVRTAQALLDSLVARGALRPGGHVVESTSGNLGIALAGLCRERGYRCTLMVDAATPSYSLTAMTELGADVVTVDAADPIHQIHARIDAVRAFRLDHPDTAWTDQYSNPAGPAVHAATTGPELLGPAALGQPDAVTIPVSTGGTLAGVIAHLRGHAPTVRVVAVDAVGSAATGKPLRPRPRKLPGFGSGLVSQLIRPDECDRVIHVTDDDAAHACRVIRARTGLSLGGSAGAAVTAATRLALDDPTISDIACLCPDGGDRYETTIYAAAAEPPTTVSDIGAITALHHAVLPQGGVFHAA
ncbi:pyridoxal-phosphate dependent enzyme [Micromonospora sp. NPDC047707]|uniref:pyridoxal-phosphate dependent enzyme n=1 Tax=Micromonospora sp. NPDC047707 TaxID=3154498 RepID=UPI0034567270